MSPMSVVALVALIGSVCAATSVVYVLPDASRERLESHAEVNGNSPDGPKVPLRPRRASLLNIPEESWRSVLARFVPRLKHGERLITEPSMCIHCLRLKGENAEYDDELLPTGHSIIVALTDYRAGAVLFGAPVFAETRYGARYRPRALLPQSRTRAEETHSNQVLASLLELGVPLSTRIDIGPKQLTLQHVLQDAICNFSRTERELEWTAVAFALGVPPATNWTNKFGETTSFDDLVGELLRRPFAGAACGGAHKLYATIVIARVDENTPLLGASARERLQGHLATTVASIWRNQADDGSWGLDWFVDAALQHAEKSPLPDSDGARLLITGHLAECVLYLPDRLIPDARCLTLAGQWLWAALLRNIDKVRGEFCPLTHAAVVVQALRVQ